MPRDNIKLRVTRDRVPYDQWVKNGLIKATDGNVVDYDVVRNDINALAERFHIKEIAIDRWNATQITTQLQGDGFTVVAFGQGFASMSAPTKELEKLVLGKQLVHNAHPVLRWMASNVAVTQDPAGNLKPAKDKSGEKIDGIVAGVMALARSIGGEKETIPGFAEL
jgi:phage terminase large subunit-like protein